MTDLLRRILGGVYDVREQGEEILLYRTVLPRHEPEDFIAVKRAQGGYSVCEVHRGTWTVRVQTAGEREAAAYGAVLCERLFKKTADQGRAKWIRACIDQGREREVTDYIKQEFDGSLYCIGKEEPQKLSFLKTLSGADVKFAGEYLAKGAALSRAYVVLNNYCRRSEEACDLWRRLVSLGLKTDRAKVLELYLFGDEKRSKAGL